MAETERKAYQYIFGPVPSRRLGLSLGVDIMPHKTCSLDCVYCECGKTTHLTIKRKAFTPVEEIKRELNDYLRHHPRLDYITFSGSGEPTLHLGLGEIIAHIKTNFPVYKIALLTNSTLLYDVQVQKEIAEIDLVIASMDAASKEKFALINRPHPRLEISRINNGLITFRKNFSKDLWIEFFVIPGVNDDLEELNRINLYLAKIGAQRVQLNTLDRPGTEDWVQPAGEDVIKRVAAGIKHAEIISAITTKSAIGKEGVNLEAHLIATLKRRPCTIEDLVKVLAISKEDADTLIQSQIQAGNIIKNQKARGTFFILKNKSTHR